jgi:hypothetical protein
MGWLVFCLTLLKKKESINMGKTKKALLYLFAIGFSSGLALVVIIDSIAIRLFFGILVLILYFGVQLVDDME